MNNQHTVREPFRHILRDSYAGLLYFTQSGLALIGLTALCILALAVTQPALRNSVIHLMRLDGGPDAWLAQSADRDVPTGEAAIRQLVGTTGVLAAQSTELLGLTSAAPGPLESSPSNLYALDNAKPQNLNASQRAVAYYLSHRYRVNPTAIELLVGAAQSTGNKAGLDPTLLLAVMAIESRFNPFAESVVGAQGLMQVMAKVHADKLDDFGGSNAALNPVVNLQVGALILKDCIRRGGSVSGGLRLYVGAGTGNDGGYGAKVLEEKGRIDAAARTGHAGRPAATLRNASHPAKSPIGDGRSELRVQTSSDRSARAG
jgi:hypothetical protein